MNADAVARSILADQDSRAAYEAALLDVPVEVAQVLDAVLAAERGRSRGWHRADDVTVLHAGE